MDKPKDSAPRSDHNQEYDRLRNAGRRKFCKRAAERQAHITLNKLKHEQADRRRHQELPRPAPDKFSVSMPVQVKPGAHSCCQIQHRHEPRIDKILKDVIVLDAQACDLSESPQYPLRIVHIKHMINDHDHNGDPSDIVQVIFSHTFPTFAIKHNISYKYYILRAGPHLPTKHDILTRIALYLVAFCRTNYPRGRSSRTRHPEHAIPEVAPPGRTRCPRGRSSR